MDTDLKHITSSAQKLQAKILKCYPEKIKIDKGKTRRVNIVLSNSLSTEEACGTQYSKVTSNSYLLKTPENLCFQESIKWEHW